MRYLPEPDAAEVPNVVVDGAANDRTVLTLSHWPRTAAPAEAWADTSTEMVLRFLDGGGGRDLAAEVATNNHFDQDGVAGLFALTRPDDARPRRALLADLARAGDFATYRFREGARASMALASMAARAPAAPYPEQCAALYVDALGLLPELLDHPDKHRALWEDEDAGLAASEALVAAGGVAVREHAAVDLAVVIVDAGSTLGGGHRFAARHVDGLHPMALHGLTSCSRLLVAQGARYRYTDRYESWVQYRSRPIPRRVDLAPLAAELTATERDGAEWTATPPSDLTPELATIESAPSSVSFAEVEAAVLRHLRSAPPAWDPY